MGRTSQCIIKKKKKMHKNPPSVKSNNPTASVFINFAFSPITLDVIRTGKTLFLCTISHPLLSNQDFYFYNYFSFCPVSSVSHFIVYTQIMFLNIFVHVNRYAYTQISLQLLFYFSVLLYRKAPQNIWNTFRLQRTTNGFCVGRWHVRVSLIMQKKKKKSL